MVRSLLRSLPVALVLLLVPASGCDLLNSGPKGVKGSCDMRSGSSGDSAMCIDFHVEPNEKAKSICKSGNYTLAKTPCPRATSLGGCSRGNLTNWYFSSSKHKTAADVQKECGGKSFLASTTPIPPN